MNLKKKGGGGANNKEKVMKVRERDRFGQTKEQLPNHFKPDELDVCALILVCLACVVNAFDFIPSTMTFVAPLLSQFNF
jgi:hypothetical protein